MGPGLEYNARERFWRWCLAAFGVVAVNGACVSGLVCQPDTLMAALTNPIAAACIAAALVLVGVFAHLLTALSN
jgi:hypothetical protein